MRKLTTLLFAISLLAASCGSAVPSLKPTGSFIENRYFSNPEQDYVYKTAISVYGHELGGILIIKKISQDTHRLVLTTDFGNKLIDATMKNGSLSINSIVDEFDRKMLIKTLEKDFSVILREKYPVHGPMDGAALSTIAVIGDESFEINSEAHGIGKIIRSGRKPRAEYGFKAENDTFAHEITIVHHDLNLLIKLHSIEK